MDQEEYWRMFDLVMADVEAAIRCNSTYLTINRLRSEDYGVALKLNQNPLFWQTTTYSLQLALFISLGRVFDKTRGTYTIDDVVKNTLEHPGFFSREELRKRKRAVEKLYGDLPDPDWMANLLESAWEPSREEMKFMQEQLSPHSAKFMEIYKPIRHTLAHRSKSSQEAVEALFSNATISDLADILGFVEYLVWGILEMKMNGFPPARWSKTKYDALFKICAEKTEALIRTL